MAFEDILIEKLYCYCIPEIQFEAIQEILERESFDVSLLLKPKSLRYWDNAAYVLSKMKPDRLLPIIDGLFNWIVDLNDPGAETIWELLNVFPLDAFMPAYERAIKKTISTRNSSSAGYLMEYIHNGKAKREDFSDDSLYDKLIEVYKTPFHPLKGRSQALKNQEDGSKDHND